MTATLPSVHRCPRCESEEVYSSRFEAGVGECASCGLVGPWPAAFTDLARIEPSRAGRAAKRAIKRARAPGAVKPLAWAHRALADAGIRAAMERPAPSDRVDRLRAVVEAVEPWARRYTARWVWRSVTHALAAGRASRRAPAWFHDDKAEAHLVYLAPSGRVTATTGRVLGGMWRRERHDLPPTMRRLVWAALEAAARAEPVRPVGLDPWSRATERPDWTPSAADHLAAAAVARDAMREAATAVYAIRGDGEPIARGLDDTWRTAWEIEDLLHGASPATRAQFFEPLAESARTDSAARALHERLSVLMGSTGQGAFIDYVIGRGPSAVDPDALDRARRRCATLAQWAAAGLGVALALDQRPTVAPLSWEVRSAAAAQHSLPHGAFRALCVGDVIYIGTDADDATLIHECVHWVLAVTGERGRRGLSFGGEEQLAAAIADKWQRRAS